MSTKQNDIPNLIRTAIRTNNSEAHKDELTSILERQQQLTTTLLGVSLALSEEHPELRNALNDLAEVAAESGAIDPGLFENGEPEIASESETESCSCNCGESEDDDELESNDAETAGPVDPLPDPEEVLNAAAQAAANDDEDDEPPSGSFREYRLNQANDDAPETNGTPSTLSEWKRQNPEKAAEASDHVGLLESIRSRDPEDI